MMVDQNAIPAHEPEEGGLWIDEGSTGRRPRRIPRLAAVSVAAACLLLIGIPVGLLVSNGSPHPGSHANNPIRIGGGPAKRSVLAALSATTDSGSFNFSYDLTEVPGTTTPTTSSCPGQPSTPCVGVGGGGTEDSSVQGAGIIDTNPMAMAASASLSEGLQVGVRVSPTMVWEVSYTDNALNPQANDGSGQSLPDFASITESTLGSREGAVAMMGMASPTGYLNLSQPAITDAAQVGTSTVDGVPVTQYSLAIDPSSLASASNVTSEEASTITAALGVLTAQGYTGIRDLISIDASGFIRESSSTVSFSDGGSVTLDGHFSNFGCAGTVLMPGAPSTSSPPPNCTSPDTGVASTTTSTTSSSTSTSTTSSSTSSTTGTPTTVVTPSVPTTPTTVTNGGPPTTTSTTAGSGTASTTSAVPGG
jgi:hypothetical protein